MRQLVLAGLLAGCATAVPFDDPCACIIIPEANGTLAARLDGVQLTFDHGNDPAGSQTAGATGYLYWPGNGASASALDLSSDGITVEATWGTAGTPDLTVAAPLVALEWDTSDSIDVDFMAGDTYALGPRGGTLRIREIAGDAENGWRIRGNFSGQVCTDPQQGQGCAVLDGSFAFDVTNLPPGAADSGLVVSG
jgi:hypothetical protein